MIITAFTDSDWAGCGRTARSTSGGVVTIGDHTIKTYCRQQKVVALSSAEAELYAMVAASAEAMAIQAYARDIGLEMSVELYADSSAALGIAKRAGIGKVRHLRTQGLWVQEVRVAGRIVYKKVLGEKNPADLLTKYMPAELMHRHLETINARPAGGRAESAPQIDNVEVESWVRKWVDKKVRFDEAVSVRPIPAVGRGRSCRGGAARAKVATWPVELMKDVEEFGTTSTGALSGSTASSAALGADLLVCHDDTKTDNSDFHDAICHNAESSTSSPSRSTRTSGKHTCGIASKCKWSELDDDELSDCVACAEWNDKNVDSLCVEVGPEVEEADYLEEKLLSSRSNGTPRAAQIPLQASVPSADVLVPGRQLAAAGSRSLSTSHFIFEDARACASDNFVFKVARACVPYSFVGYEPRCQGVIQWATISVSGVSAFASPSIMDFLKSRLSCMFKGSRSCCSFSRREVETSRRRGSACMRTPAASPLHIPPCDIVAQADR